jgi:maleylacetate reductase
MDRVIFGRPAAAALAAEAERLQCGRVFMLVSGTLNRKTGEIRKVAAALGERCAGVYDDVPQHTSRQGAVAAARAARAADADLIVAIGGGSVVDCAKIALLCLEHKIDDAEALDRFAIRMRPDGSPVLPEFRGPSVRMIAAPSTLSGGEYNAGCLVTDTVRELKQSFLHPQMVPLAVILDPDLTAHTPLPLWVGSGTRAMDHAIEALCSSWGTPLVDAAVLRGIELMATSLPRSKADFGDRDLRRQCAIASWLCSYGLQSRVLMGASHAIGHVLGGTCGVPHYFCTPVMLPSILRYNREATAEPQRALAATLGRPGADAAAAFAEFSAGLGLPTRLADVGVTRDRFELIARNAMKEIFTFTNPRPIRRWQDIAEILELAA